MNTRRVTISQVAQEARVSTQTVSRVINDHPDVSTATRQRVHAVIARLGYEPSAIARSLIRGRSRTLGIVASALDYYGPAHILAGVEQQAHALGYSLLLSLLHAPDEGQQILSALLARQVEGIIWAAPEIDGSRAWLQPRLANLAVPVVFTNTPAGEGFSTVSIDNLSGGRLAVVYLVESGYQHIGLISGPLSWWEAGQRAQGWRQALEAGGRLAEARQVAHGDWSAASGGRAFAQLIQQFPEMDALFACNDQMALGALQAANRMGRQAPADLGVVGFDDIPEAPFFTPPLTTVRQPLGEVGTCAVQELHRLIEARQSGAEDIAPACIWLQTELVKRDSTTVFDHHSIE